MYKPKHQSNFAQQIISGKPGLYGAEEDEDDDEVSITSHVHNRAAEESESDNLEEELEEMSEQEEGLAERGSSLSCLFESLSLEEHRVKLVQGAIQELKATEEEL